MNLGRGVPAPLENKVVRNGEIWVPPTPEKLVVHRSGHVTAEMEQNLMGAENWSDLLGIYTGLLQDETSHRQPPGFNPCSQVGLNRGEIGQNVAPIETCNGLPPNSNAASFIDLNGECNVQDLTFAENCKGIPKDLNPTSFVGQSRWELEHGLRDVAPVDNLRILNQYGGTVGYYVQNLDDLPPQKVDSLPELMGTNKHPRATLTNGPPNRPASSIGNSTIFNQHSLVRSNGKMHGSSSSILLQNHILNEDLHFSSHNLQQISTNTFPVPYHADHNLNLPQRLKGASSSGTMPFQFELVTPDLQKQMKNNQPMQVPKFWANDCSTREKHKKDDAVCSQPSEILEIKQDEFGRNPGTSSTVILTPPNEKIHSDGGNGEIDLNKTPQQRPPKRKKHRPKVIVEGEAKRTPKSAASINRAADKNPSEKRKYVQKKGTRTSTTPLTDVAKDVEGSNVGSAVKSCRRVLNFNLENGVEKNSQATEVGNQTQNEERSKVPINLNLDSPNTEWVRELNKAAKSTQHIIDNLYNRDQSVNHSPEFSPLSSTPSPPASKGHTLNVIARSLNAQNANANQNGGQNRYNQLHQLTSGDLVQLVMEANSNEANLDRMRQPNLHTKTQLLEDLVPAKENQGCKRDHSQTERRQPQTVTLMGSQLWSSNLSHASHCNSKICLNASETMKKRRIEGIIHGTTSSISSRITSVEDYTGQMDTKCKSLHAHSPKIYLSDGIPNSDTKGQCTSGYQNDEFNKFSCDWYMKCKDSDGKFQQQHTSPYLHAKEKAQKTFDHPTQVQSTNSFATVTNWNLEFASERDPTTRGNEVVDSRALVPIKRQIAGQTSEKLSSINKVLTQLITHSRGRGRPPKAFTGSQALLRNSSSVDYIIDRMKGLNINASGKEIGQEERHALVPYRGDGAIFSHEAFDLIKKHRQRPKVDLDPETNRLWNFLMGKEGGESADAMGDNKQQWWEKERLVLRNRADSFIARMHLVQGDRRFSKWKGSVVDSVIGVFLTQNVSDHLSSSAFMHLAAKFPIKSTTVRESCCRNGQSSLIERQKVRITYPDGTSYDHRMMREPVYNPSSMTSSESSECGVEIFSTRRTYILNDRTKKIEEDMISSQSFSESVIFQASEDIRYSSGSNSEAEDKITGGNFSRNQGPSSFYEQAERIGAFRKCQLEVNGSSFPSTSPVPAQQQLENPMHGQSPQLTSSENACTHPFASSVPCHQRPVTLPTSSWPNMSKGLEKLEGNILPISGKGSISSMASTDANVTNGTGVENRHAMSGQNVERNFITQQIGRPKSQPSAAGNSILNEHFEQQTYSSAYSQSRKDQHVVNYRKDGTQETFQQEHAFLTGPTRLAEVSSKPSIGNQKHSKNITPEPSEMSQVHSSNGPPSSEIGTKISHVSKQKAEKEKADSFNWDALRNKVQSETGMRARSADTMDSIDYEAIRNADVHEISETIKERGMNNMLAERIKDFLNRLVQDHERIDLEWLRDVQPNKVKDYLLSIRGLGLKSVECVRLLTLHNVAFPVDTNVGRIAVRLGWVPLRPLPESLQLHLLELYPVLESIQKYLWPRLCHLDQETLYELHYQMITFGKVFCTKRDPNCNACPMRGDCRHFASAYASARLALPGTEGRQIVCSSAPTSANQMSDMTMKPMPLPPSKDNFEKGGDSMRNSEPIIEEPKTPEPPTEVAERDIEDAYYEDPDEIPVIKLNIEEFTSNLQSFMQDQNEMQGDMSKALVALSPEFASIPMPKLKNVSRLRTEHQVYELPDLHPLLKGLDKREPDDPSPYLLAIWTPGETSDSVQPPESKCESQVGGRMCDKKTCFSCSSTREAQAQTVRGTILIPCRTAMRGSFPLNGTYFQVNEVFADHESSMNPIFVPRSLLWNLPRRTVFFGTSVTTIFKGLTTEGIQYCFWKGFICVRGFDQKTRAPRPLSSRLHHPASKMLKPNVRR